MTQEVYEEERRNLRDMVWERIQDLLTECESSCAEDCMVDMLDWSDIDEMKEYLEMPPEKVKTILVESCRTNDTIDTCIDYCEESMR